MRKGLPEAGAVHGTARAELHVQLELEVRLDLVEIHNLIAARHRQERGLAGVAGQLFEHWPSQARELHALQLRADDLQ